MKQFLTTVASILVAGGILLLGWGTSLQTSSLGGSAINVPTPFTASSTVFTLTTSSTRLLATSSSRIAATVQARNCGTDSQVFLRAQEDKPAVTNSGPMVFATTTFAFETFPGVPVPVGAVTGITNTGTCTVVVTEWRKLP